MLILIGIIYLYFFIILLTIRTWNMEASKKRKLAYGLGALSAIALGFILIKFFPKKDLQTSTPLPTVSAAAVIGEDIDNLNSGKQPDMVVVTKKFTTLWRDVLQTSFLKKIINEDILFYYEEAESSLSLKGAVRRIAFERNTTMLDDLLAWVMDRPMQLAYWKAYHGRLDHFMGVTKRSNLTDAMRAIAEVALSDKQLKVAGKKDVDGKQVEVYQLNYSSQDSVYFYSLNDEIVFYSSYHLPVLTKELRRSIFKEGSDDVKASDSHTLFVSTNFLSFGYQFFSPGLDTIRFSYDHRSGWGTALSNGKVLGTETLLKAVPVYPAFCSFAPFSLAKAESIFALPAELKGKISEHVGVCWYSDSQVFSPLFIFKTKETIAAQTIQGLFEEVVGSFEKGILTPEEAILRASQIEQLNRGETVAEVVRAKNFAKPFPVASSAGKKSWKLVREISSPHGPYQAKDSGFAQDMRSKNFFKVTLAHHKEILLFSADDKLVDKALAALEKNYPNAQDLMKGDEIPLFLFDPVRVAELIKKSSLDSLPEGEEALFRESLKQRLFPALQKLQGIKPILGSVSAEAQKNLWSEVEWRTYSSR
jgi:uncharacterized protein YfaA (DUF2138 family)